MVGEHVVNELVRQAQEAKENDDDRNRLWRLACELRECIDMYSSAYFSYVQSVESTPDELVTAFAEVSAVANRLSILCDYLQIKYRDIPEPPEDLGLTRNG